jgi:hypothetical protein
MISIDNMYRYSLIFLACSRVKEVIMTETKRIPFAS